MTASQLRGLVTGAQVHWRCLTLTLTWTLSLTFHPNPNPNPNPNPHQELVSDLDGMGFAAHLRGGQEGLWHHALDALDAHAARIVEKEAVSAEARNLVI